MKFQCLKMVLVVIAMALLAIRASAARLGSSKDRKKRSIEQSQHDSFHDSYMFETERLDQMKKKCGVGHFFSLGSKTCEDCNRLCPNGENMENCESDCKLYYMKLKQDELEEQIRQARAVLKECMKLPETLQWKVTMALVVVVSLHVLISVAALIRHFWKQRSTIKPEEFSVKYEVVEKEEEPNHAPVPSPTKNSDQGYANAVNPTFDANNTEYHVQQIPTITGSDLQSDPMMRNNSRDSRVQVDIDIHAEPPSGVK